MSTQKRLLFYLLLALLTVVVPYIITMVCIIITMDRIDGMKMGVIPGLIAVHIIFGLMFIENKWLYKIVSIIILATVIYGLAWLSLSNGLIKTSWGNYGYWDLAVTNFLIGLIAWETFYQVDNRLKKNWL